MHAVIIQCLVLFFMSFAPLSSAGLLKRNQIANINIENKLQLPDQEQQFEIIPIDFNEHPRSLATQTNKAYFTVREVDRKFGYTSPGDVHIKIFNHSPDKWYSVTVVSPGVYTGTANFLRKVMDRPGNPLLYSWIPKMRGDYEIIVHELNIRDTVSVTPPLDGEYKFSVVDRPGFDSRQFILNEIEKMPPCQTVKDRTDLYTVWDGSWIGPNLHGSAPGMRTGWYFLPSRDMFCRMEFFTDAELRANPDEKSIYILGSSKERGVFLSLVDMILDTNEKVHLNESVIAKCWGRAFVLKNNLKVFYQDWRSNYFQNIGSSSDYLCHNEKVVREGGLTYTENGLSVWNEIFKDRSSWPSVILMSTGNDEGFYGEYDLQHFINTLPSTWQGTLLLTDGAFSAMRAGNGDESEYVKYRNVIKELVSGLNDQRVRWIDGKGISKEHRMYGEHGPNHVTGSQHFHGHCQASYVDESGKEQSMKICSNVTEVLSQLLIGYALGPKEEYTKRIQQTGSIYNGNKEAMYCHACPEDLLPFHITPHPEMTCAAGALHARSKNEIHSGVPQLCPEPCFDIPPSKVVQTQSGVVNERNCPAEYFLSTPNIEADNLDQMSKEVDQLEEQMKQMLPPPEQNNQMVHPEQMDKMAHPEQVSLLMHPDQASQSTTTRMVDMTQVPPGVNAADTRVPGDEVESMSASLSTLWKINLVFLVILAICHQSKIKSLLHDNMHNTDNPYTSRISFSGTKDPTVTKYVLGASAGVFLGILCIVSFPQSKDSNQSLRSTSAIQNVPAAQLQVNPVVTADRRPVMSTFFEPVEGGCCGMSEEGHRNLVKSWEAAWQSLGWDTKVYNAEDAKRHPKFVDVEQKLRAVGMNEYDQRCFWRWLAAADDGDPMGGWQSDYDTFPLTLTAEKGLELMATPGFKSWTRHVPSLLHGDQKSWNKMVDVMIDHIREDLDSRYRISDMVIIMYLRDHYNLDDLGITVWEGQVYPGFPYHPSEEKPTIDCDTARQYLAAHISHASSQTDYNEKHTYPKLEGKGMVITAENVHYSAENRAEAGSIMIEDFKTKCVGNGYRRERIMM